MATPERVGRLDPKRAGDLGDALRALGYTYDGVRSAVGATGAVLYPGETAKVVWARRLRDDSLGAAVRLLLLGDDLDETSARRSLPLTTLEAAGVVRRSGGAVHAVTRITPYDHLLLASDRDDGDRRAPSDQVPPPGNASRFLDRLTVREPVRRALDVGTGCGVHALLAARHSDHVVATDVNPQALAYMRFNAALNHVENVETRSGSLFESVESESFGLIVSNPPFVISPDVRFVFRDGQGSAEALCAELTRAIPGYLEPDGIGQALAAWTIEPGQDWTEPPRGWLAGSAAAWLLRYDTRSPLDHARMWNAPMPDRDEYASTLDRWIDQLGGPDGRRVVLGAVFLHAGGVAAPVRTDELPRRLPRPVGAHVLRAFRNRSRLARSTPLELPLRLVGSAFLTRALVPAEGSWEVRRATLRLRDGIPFAHAIGSELAELLVRLDGRTPARRVAAAEHEPELRELLELGFLEIGEDPGPV